MRTDKSATNVIKAEDLDDVVAKLFAEAQALGAALRETPSKRVITRHPRKADIKDRLSARLRTSLEDELVPAVQTVDGDISEREIDREVTKKALIGLKLATLRTIARQRGLATSGNLEDVAEQVAKSYSWDQEEIARLILAYAEPDDPARAHVDRLFPLRDSPDMTYVRDRLSYVAGRYVRIGIARWFVFKEMRPISASIEQVSGVVRTYQASVDETETGPQLHASPSRSDVRLLLDSHEPLVRVRQASILPARSAVRALAIAANVSLQGALQLPAVAATGSATRIHPQSLFMLDLLHTRLREAGFKDINLTVARFKMSDALVDDAESRPILRAVRFEGAHLLDSVAACKLLADGRPLTEMALMISTVPKAGEYSRRYPVRVTLEPDHAAVITGYGTDKPESSLEVHRRIVRSLAAEMHAGHADVDRLQALISRVLEQARSSHDAKRATMLTDPADSSGN